MGDDLKRSAVVAVFFCVVAALGAVPGYTAQGRQTQLQYNQQAVKGYNKGPYTK
jgi:hypothetical protein